MEIFFISPVVEVIIEKHQMTPLIPPVVSDLAPPCLPDHLIDVITFHVKSQEQEAIQISQFFDTEDIVTCNQGRLLASPYRLNGPQRRGLTSRLNRTHRRHPDGAASNWNRPCDVRVCVCVRSLPRRCVSEWAASAIPATSLAWLTFWNTVSRQREKRGNRIRSPFCCLSQRLMFPLILQLRFISTQVVSSFHQD